MAPRKRRKVYLDPGSDSRMPKSTKWLLDHPRDDASRPPGGHAPSSVAPTISSPTSPVNTCPDQICNESVHLDSTSEEDGDEDCSDSDSEYTTYSHASVPPPASPFSAEEDILPTYNSAGPSCHPKDSDADDLSDPFIDGGTVTRGDAYMLLLDLALKFGLSWAAIEEIQRLFNNLLGKKCFPETKYLFKKVCGIDVTDVTFNFYCADCKDLLAQTKGSLEERQKLHVECAVCRKNYAGQDLMRTGSFFVSLPIERQLMSILSSRTASTALAENLEQPQNSNGLMRDIADGHQYLSTRKKVAMAPHDLTLTVNSDGSPVYKSSKFNIWPVQVILNELPPRLRWSNVMTPLLWYGQQHPHMPMLLQAFVQQLEKLNVTGITWTLSGSQVCSKVFCICCCADAPARAAMQQMVQFNGYFGCSWCYHPGINVEGTIKYCVDQPYADRTDEQVLMDMRAACHTGTIVRGVKGPSPLINLPGFSPAWSWCPDYMHCILLGVSRQLTELWFSDTGTEYYCGMPSTMRLINERLCAIRMPVCVNRQPRPLQVRKYWKASEWQYWLLHYSVPCLAGVLEEKYVTHWSLLVSGVFLLLKDAISSADVDLSTKLLTEFVVGVEFLYGRNNMTYNVHQVLHLPKSAILFGPLWTHSCFTFETNMGKLLQLITSANGVALQIATRLLLRSSLLVLKTRASSHALSLIKESSERECLDSITPLGKPEVVRDVSAHGQLQEKEVVEFRRVKVRGAVIASERYTKHVRTNSSAVVLPDGTYAKAKRIFCSREPSGEEHFYIVTEAYSVYSILASAHIKSARKLGHECLLEIDTQIQPCIYFCFNNCEYFCDFVNSYEWF